MSRAARPTSRRFESILDVIAGNATDKPGITAFIRLDGQGQETGSIQYGELHRRACAVAAALQERVRTGDRVLLLYPTGIDFVVAFLGCLYARVIAVPAYLPAGQRFRNRLTTIAADCTPRLVLSMSSTFRRFSAGEQRDGCLKDLAWLCTDALQGDDGSSWVVPDLRPESVAMLQYTSGSTQLPRGVMVTHGNMAHNQKCIYEGAETAGDDTVGVCWLPHYHDMGLFGFIVQSLYGCYPCILLSPTDFVRDPMIWLEAISRYRATISGSPNFGYEHCAQFANDPRRDAVDLSSWRIAFNGAEPVKAQTLERFTNAFSRCGFTKAAFRPSYGLAEATLLVAHERAAHGPTVLTFERDSIRQNRVTQAVDKEDGIALVSLGSVVRDHEVAVVDSVTGLRCDPRQIGEIWLAGASVCAGYWQNPELTRDVFQARLAELPDKLFLRTGDLGFLFNGEVFITGRMKDVIIIRGNNHYPHDIEQTVERACSYIDSAKCAAFSIEVEAEERVVIVAEADRAFDASRTEEAVQAIRQAVAEEHELGVYIVCFVKPASLPRTSSGKLQRYACREQYLAGRLSVIAVSKVRTREAPAPMLKGKSGADIRQWLVTRIAAEAGLAAAAIDIRAPFASFGLDSVTAMRLTGELETMLGRSFHATLLYEYPTIDVLARHLAGEIVPQDAAPERDSAVPVTREPVAIIGLACRLPGAPTAAAYWKLLHDGQEGLAPSSPEHRHPPVKFRGGYLDGIDQFDPLFFGIPPREAACIDPQHRILLELACEALDDAGQPREKLKKSRTGVFIGISNNEYGVQLQDTFLRDEPYSITGNAMSLAANRMSHFFNWHGPSVVVDTACSSSLVAVHMACRAIWNGEAEAAIAGGVNLILNDGITQNFLRAGALSAQGRCAAFDATADGIVRSEGAGVVVLKPLGKALEDRDPVYAVILGTAVNHDGLTNGITAPNPAAQEQVLADAWRDARITSEDLQYVEAHGTGTQLGDPIEVLSLAASLGPARRDLPCYIGSAKTNIGHTEAAAGIAGLIKVALSLRNQILPASLHFETPNPHIPFDQIPVRVWANRGRWPRHNGRCMAGVSAFGFGGANAHVVVASAPVQSADHGNERKLPGLLPLSAHNPEALRELAHNYEQWMADNNHGSSDLVFTAAVRRSHSDHRLAAVFRSDEELQASLAAWSSGTAQKGCRQGRKPPGGAPAVVWIFSGHGGQYARMGAGLLNQAKVFRSVITRCHDLIYRELGWSLLDEFDKPETVSRFTGGDLAVAPLALFSVQTALAALLRSWGVVPAAVVGHSVGEVAAAVAAGVLPLEDGLRVIIERSRLLAEGVRRTADRQSSMVVVRLPLSAVTRAVKEFPKVSVAAENGPRTTVVSGFKEDLEPFAEHLRHSKIAYRALKVPGAGHHPDIGAFSAPLMDALSGLKPAPGLVPFISTVTGKPEAADSLGPAYWRQNLTSPVLFATAIRHLIDSGKTTFVEIGPDPTLVAGVRDCGRDATTEIVAVPSLRRGQEDYEALLGTVAELYVNGADIQWKELLGDSGRCVNLPPFPWRKQRCWFDSSRRTRRNTESHPWLGQVLQSAVEPSRRFWEVTLDPQEFPLLSDHCVQGVPILPATGYLEILYAAARDVFNDNNLTIEDLTLHRALPVRQKTIGQVVMEQTSQNSASLQFFEKLEGDLDGEQSQWVLLASAKTRVAPEEGPVSDAAALATALMELSTTRVSAEKHYAQLRAMGAEYGPAFQAVQALRHHAGKGVGTIRLDKAAVTRGRWWAHPALMDSCLQVLATTVDPSVTAIDRRLLFLPVSIASLRLYGRLDSSAEYRSCVRLHAIDQSHVAGDVIVLSDNGHITASIHGVRFEAVGGLRQASDESWFWTTSWVQIDGSAAQHSLPQDQWIIFRDRSSLADSLAAILEQKGNRVVSVSLGTAFARTSERAFTINGGNPADFRKLITELGHSCAGIIYLSAIGAGEGTRQSVSAAVLHLIQAAGSLADGSRLFLVTAGAQQVPGDGALAEPWQAPVWGLGKTAAFEHAELRPKLIDLHPDRPEAQAALLAAELSYTDDEDQVALRQGTRWAARITRLSDTGEVRKAVRQDAAYLITGGLGGLGLTTAEWLIEQGARHLVLAGRSAPDDVARLRVARWNEKGVNVRCVRADVSDSRSMSDLFGSIAAEMPPLRGVIHSAGTLDDHLIRDMTWQHFSDVTKPKIDGAWNLHCLTRDIPLDFFILYSSAASLFGSPGQANYVAANEFLDELAAYRRASGFPALSIQWGPWAGVGGDLKLNFRGRLALRGVESLSPQEGMSALSALLGCDKAVAAAIRLAPAQLIAAYPALETIPRFRELAPQPGVRVRQSIRSIVIQLPAQDRKTAVCSYLAGEVASSLGVKAAQLDFETSLRSWGIDSLIALELKNRVEADFQIRFPVIALMEGPSIGQIADLVLREVDKAETSLPAEYLTPERTECFPLSAGQEALWFQYRLAPESSVYNISFAARCRAAISTEALAAAIRLLALRHPSLRARFAMRDGNLVQSISPLQQNYLQTFDATGWDLNAVRTHVNDEANRPFALETGPVFRACLYSRSPADHVLLLSVHHIVGDFWSLSIFLEELGSLYQAQAEGRQLRLQNPAAQYQDFVHWQHSELAGDTGRAHLNFWRETLRSLPPPIQLPTDRPFPQEPSFKGASVHFVLDSTLTASLHQLASASGATLYMVLLSALQSLLFRYSREWDILIASPMLGRPHAEFADVIGHFTNFVPIRSRIAGDMPFFKVLDATRQTVLDALEHQDYPYSWLVEQMHPPRTPGRPPICQVALMMEKSRAPGTAGALGFFVGRLDSQLQMGNLPIEPFPIEKRGSQLDLVLMAEQTGSEIVCVLEYRSDVFDAGTAERIGNHYRTILQTAASNPEMPVGRLKMLPDQERGQIISWNDTAADLPVHCVHELVEKQAKLRPHAVAVVCNRKQWTYADLDSAARRIAATLLNTGVTKGSLIAVIMNRTPEMVAALLGILRAGAAYVPIDPRYPEERIRWTLSDTDAWAVVTDSDDDAFADNGRFTFQVHEILSGEVLRAEDTLRTDPEALAYVLYTSGSTGRPKGVPIAHRSLTNLLYAMQKHLELTPSDVFLAVTTLSFDIAALELFAPLIYGGRLELADEATVSDPRLLAAKMQACQATVMQATPATWQMLVDSGWPGSPSLRIICGGDALTPTLRGMLLSRCRRLWNAYGPTEATIWSTIEAVTNAHEPVTIGRPLENTSAWILDEFLQLAPIGVIGTLYLGGIGLAAGYLHQPEMTRAKFVPNPYRAGELLYNTGDLARFLPDGRIEMRGRSDRQVKVRGFRVELDEVEGALAALPDIASAAVVLENDRLIASIVPKTRVTTAASVRSELRRTLPEYVIPSVIQIVESLPLSLNGKVDRKNLPAAPNPDDIQAVNGHCPQDPIQDRVVELWREMLGKAPLGVHDNFFEAGGHSLSAVRLLARVEQEFKVSVPVRVMLQQPTVHGLTAAVRSGDLDHSAPVLLNQSSGAPPLFLISGSGGSMRDFLSLAAALTGDFDSYALTFPATDEPLNVDLLAAKYCKSILASGKGPCIIGGHSDGGVIAQEVARLLSEQGVPVMGLVLIDSAAPDIWQHEEWSREWKARILRSLEQRAASASPSLAANLVAMAYKHLEDPEKVLEEKICSDFHPVIKQAFAMHAAVASHRVKPCHVPVMLFKTAERTSIPNDLEWRKYSSNLQIVNVPGNHLSILSLPYITEITEHLRLFSKATVS